MALEITLTHDNGKDRARCSSFAQAAETLDEWASRPPGRRQQSSKVTYVLTDAKRGLFFRNSLDLVVNGPDRIDLGQDLIRYLSWVCGLARPPRRTEQQYRSDISQFSAAMVSRARTYLEIVTTIVNEEQSHMHLEEMAMAPGS